MLAGTLLCSPKLRIKTSKVLNQPLSNYLLLNWWESAYYGQEETGLPLWIAQTLCEPEGKQNLRLRVVERKQD